MIEPIKGVLKLVISNFFSKKEIVDLLRIIKLMQITCLKILNLHKAINGGMVEEFP